MLSDQLDNAFAVLSFSFFRKGEAALGGIRVHAVKRPCERDWREHEEFPSKEISVSLNRMDTDSSQKLIHTYTFMWCRNQYERYVHTELSNSEKNDGLEYVFRYRQKISNRQNS